MAAENVDVENISFSSARSLFEKKETSSKSGKSSVLATQSVKQNGNFKQAPDVSTATTEWQTKSSSRADNSLNNSRKSLPNKFNKDNEISVTKTSFVMRPASNVTPNRNSLILMNTNKPSNLTETYEDKNVPFAERDGKTEERQRCCKLEQFEIKVAPGERENVVETKLNLNKKLLSDEPSNLKSLKKISRDSRAASNSNLVDTRQMLLNDIVNMDSRKLYKVSTSKETIPQNEKNQIINKRQTSTAEEPPNTHRQDLSGSIIPLGASKSVDKNENMISLKMNLNSTFQHNHHSLQKDSPECSSQLQTNMNAVAPSKESTKSKMSDTLSTNVTSNKSVPLINHSHQEEQDASVPCTDFVGNRLFLSTWDPTKLVKELYRIELPDKASTCSGSPYINKTGYMECLPISKTKNTFLKMWKRKFFRAQDGKISIYEGPKNEEETVKLELAGGKVEDIGPRMLGIEDGRGHYLVVRCSLEQEAAAWKSSIHSQTAEDVSSNWIRPVSNGLTKLSESKRVVIIEVGSCSVRAGILSTHPSLPTVFFPTIVASHQNSKKKFYGFEAFRPNVRSASVLSYPVRPSNKIDKYSLDWESLSGLFEQVFKQLGLEPHQCSVMFSAPTNFNHQIRSKFMELFFNHFHVRAVNMMSQALLSLYSYKVDTGLVVDAGERIEILPVIDGFVVEGGVMRLPYGGQRACEIFNSFLAGRKYRFSTDAEFQLVRYAVEKLCYVSMNFKSDFEKCLDNSEPYRKSLPLDEFDLAPEAAEQVTCDISCFKSTEGFFDMNSWGVDSLSLQRMIHKAISLCPIDSRRQMWRNIYLSGGITMLPNFKERLEMELTKLALPNVVIQVHSSPYRYHASYLGACAVANMDGFQDTCTTLADWKAKGQECVKRYPAY